MLYLQMTQEKKLSGSLYINTFMKYSDRKQFNIADDQSVLQIDQDEAQSEEGNVSLSDQS